MAMGHRIFSRRPASSLMRRLRSWLYIWSTPSTNSPPPTKIFLPSAVAAGGANAANPNVNPDPKAGHRRGLANLRRRLRPHLSTALKGSVLLLTIATYAACPLLVPWAKVVGYELSPHGDGVVAITGWPFREGAVILAEWLLIGAAGLLFSVCSGDMHAVRQCLDWRAIVRIAPSGMGWALADSCEVLAVARIDPATYGMISQARLLGAAAARWLFRGASQTQAQWALLAVLTLTCMGYCALPDEPASALTPSPSSTPAWSSGADRGWFGWLPSWQLASAAAEAHDSDYWVGVLLTLVNVVIAVCSGLYAEVCFKPSGQGQAQALPQPPLHVQMTQASFSGAFGALLLYLTLCWVRQEDPSALFEGPDGHWSHRTVVLVVVYAMRDWVCNACIKAFNDVAKTICNALSLVVTYSFTVAVTGEREFSTLKASLLLLAVFDAVKYIATRHAPGHAVQAPASCDF